MKQKFLHIIGAVFALFLGVMSAFAGTTVLLGAESKDYNVLKWLVIYNVVLGVISIVTAFLIWKNVPISKKLILVILGMHFSIFLYLKFISETVAVESIQAMVFRVSVWVVIAILIIVIPKYFYKK
ncbi:hypothetical protein MPF19_00540 [Polaribacter sp. Z014]|uniref:hypothetical protein n=1 Tax=unclassified Polaribacter TaxID=196858 RepID=UPI00193C5E0C|nr:MULTISPECIES: hypothetical protein [unclassified Polaribacter]MCL7761881.1 hypothetical protein [Polaribacter sp. Z014]QVY64723.1 hypothetical protein JOP69_13250 [Polaribacter sp. Q13]